MLKSILNLFKPYKWETVYSVKCKAFLANRFMVTPERVECLAVIQVERSTNQSRARLLSGGVSADMSIIEIVGNCPAAADVCRREGIEF